MRRNKFTSGYKKCPLTNWSKDNEIQVIDIPGGYEVKVDKWYYNKNCLFTWYIGRDKYIYRKEQNKTIWMHRDVLSANDSIFNVDHINGNTFDNRECNLRLCTAKENSYNSKKPESAVTSKFKGVSKKGNKWTAHITKNGKTHHLGTHSDEVTAALIYDSAAVYLFGEFAKINFTAHKEKLLIEKYLIETKQFKD